MNDLAGMTQTVWNTFSKEEQERMRDNSHLTPQLIGLEGWRVEVMCREGGKPWRFIVGKSTGWRPCHLEIKTTRSMGGSPARDRYHSVRKIRKVR